jgi:hypothetical protein
VKILDNDVMDEPKALHRLTAEENQRIMAAYSPGEQEALHGVDFTGLTLKEAAEQFTGFEVENLAFFMVTLWPDEFDVDY